uniref:KHG/KDPG aldolase n=1 Tax=Quercus lobata TaxID=97700 RepID=A0A7N2LEA9_QUELO
MHSCTLHVSGYGNNKPHPQQHVRLHLASKLSATATASASAEGLLLFFYSALCSQNLDTHSQFWCHKLAFVPIELALKAAHAALSGGISVLEIVMSTPGVFEVLQQLVQEHPTTTLGIGTVLNVADAKNAINAGAKFLMSPAMVKDIMVDAQCGEVLYIPGVMTPTEMLSAYDSGAKIVKVSLDMFYDV